ncbi:MAG: phosphate acyltransferase [Gemmatimonadota bacterium]|jgi:phosphate butyryltransferase
MEQPLVRMPGSLPLGPLSTLEDVRRKARSLPTRIVAIAAAQDQVALEAAAVAEREGLARCVLVGDQHRIEAILWDLEEDPADFQIVNRQEIHDSVDTAVQMVREGEAHILMKGKVTSADLMKAVLQREAGLRTGRLLSDVFLFDSPLPGAARLIGITDGGINLAPELEAKGQILMNALEVFRILGHEEPKAAVLSAIEKVNPDLPSTVDAAELARRAGNGEFGSCQVAGPLAMDLAVSADAARRKGVDTPVAGIADILLFPSIESANIAAKTVQYMAGVEVGHVVVGAATPVLIPSRSENARAKTNAVALGRLMVG